MAKGFLSAVADLLFPALCPLCDAAPRGESGPCCPACLAGLSRARPFAARLAVSGGPGGGALPVRAGGPYDGALRRAILACKIGGRRELLPELARIACAAFDPEAFGGTEGLVLVPVPSEPRGAPPADRVGELSLLVAARLGVPVAPGALVRRAGAAGQVGRSREERLARAGERLMAGDAALKESARPLVFDDIITTGATAQVACTLLAARGGRVAGVLAVAAVG